MKKILLLLVSLLAASFAFQACEDFDDTAVPVNDFVWKGLNLFYLWKEEVPALADERFSNQSELNDFVDDFSSPEDLFESLLYKRGQIDRWSVIFSDYRVLENALQGVAKSNGVDFALVYEDDSQTSLFGYVRYIMPGSDAASKDIQRGDVFYAVNGVPLTADNYQSLLGNDTYTLNLADYNDGEIIPNGEEVTLTKTEYAENPVHLVQTYTEGSHTIGYIMYNGFYSNYDADINVAFGQLAAAGVTDLVLDLRYNSGGSIRTAGYIASMITGQFTGQLFAKEQWNSRLQDYYESKNPRVLERVFASQLANGAPINHLSLNKVYILTTGSTASASELVINSLAPYIDVVTIGTSTTGKNVGSVTLYDSQNFSASGRNGSHRYAMQPIVLRIVNREGFGEYSGGLDPDYVLPEDLDFFGALGSPDEPLLAAAIGLITGDGRPARRTVDNVHKSFKDSKSMRRFGTEMYIEQLPEGSTELITNLP